MFTTVVLQVIVIFSVTLKAQWLLYLPLALTSVRSVCFMHALSCFI